MIDFDSWPGRAKRDRYLSFGSSTQLWARSLCLAGLSFARAPDKSGLTDTCMQIAFIIALFLAPLARARARRPVKLSSWSSAERANF